MGKCHNQALTKKYADGKVQSIVRKDSNVECMTATEESQDIEKVSQTGYYNIFSVVDQDEITFTLVHDKMYFEVANVGAGVGGGFINMQELRVMTYN
jgi:hypothetical protein